MNYACRINTRITTDKPWDQTSQNIYNHLQAVAHRLPQPPVLCEMRWWCQQAAFRQCPTWCDHVPSFPRVPTYPLQIIMLLLHFLSNLLLHFWHLFVIIWLVSNLASSHFPLQDGVLPDCFMHAILPCYLHSNFHLHRCCCWSHLPRVVH